MKRWFVLVALLGGCGTAEVVDVQPPPPAEVLVVSPAELDFGAFRVGDSFDETLVLTNRGATLLIIETRVEDAPEGLTVTLDDLALHPGASADVQVRFVPEREAAFASTVTFSSGGNRAVATIRGHVDGCALRVEPNPIELSAVIGAVAFTDEVVFENVTNETLTTCPDRSHDHVCNGPPWRQRLCVHQPSRWDFITNCMDLQPGRWAVTAWHRPTRPGLLEGTVTYTINGCDEVVRLRSFAEWGDLECPLDVFASWETPPDRCETRTVRCVNRADRPIAISGWSVDVTDITVSPSRALVLEPGEVLPIVVEHCNRNGTLRNGLLTLEGDFESPPGKMELWLGK